MLDTKVLRSMTTIRRLPRRQVHSHNDTYGNCWDVHQQEVSLPASASTATLKMGFWYYPI